MAIYYFGDFGKVVGACEEMLAKMTSASCIQQKMFFGNFRKYSEQGEKFHKG